MAATDIRKTVLQIVQEVHRKIGLNAPASLTANEKAILSVDYLNDVIDEISDYGNWQEVVATSHTTAVGDQQSYSVNVTSNVVIKNIRDIYFGSSSSRLRFETVDDFRRLENSNTSPGEPRQYTIFGTDTNANPILKVNPTPGTSQDGKVMSVLYYEKPRLYTTSDDSIVVPFPSRVVAQGLLYRLLLDQDAGAQRVHTQQARADFVNMLKEAFNRFNGDTGIDKRFRPSRGFRRRR